MPWFAGRVVPGYAARGDAGLTDSTGHDTGVASVVLNRAPAARVMPVVLDWCAGIDHAVSRGVKVIAVVMVTYQDIPCLRDAVARAVAADVSVLAGVGNDGTQRTTPVYPADYPSVIGVGSIDYSHWRPSWATVGPSVDLVAYGDRVTVLNRDGSWGYASGSSYATGNLAGAVAAMRAAHPDWSQFRVWDELRAVAVDLGGSGCDWWFGCGFVA